MNAFGSDVMQAKGVIKERIKVRDGVPFTWRLLVNHNNSFSSRTSQSFIMCQWMLIMREKTMSCLWLQEKSCDMEGNAEAESAGERAEKLESSYF